MTELPRLLLCSFDVLPGPSGASRRLTEYLTGLSDHFNVVVLSAKTPDHSHIEKYQGARLLRVPIGSGDLASKLQAFDRAVRRQLESEEYVVVHFTDPFGGYALCELRESYGYRLVYDAQSFPSQELRYTHPQVEGDRKLLARIRRQELFCLMNADRVLTGSEVTRAFIRSLGVPREQIEILRAPVDLTPYTEATLGVPDGSPMRAIYLGSQVAWQGLPTLLRGLHHAVKKVDVRLVIVGPPHPAWQPILEDLVRELRLEQHVEFQPPVPHADLHKVLALADVGMVPVDDLERNRVQGGALAKVAEYLAAGRPVIASDLPVTRELLREDCTLFHEPGDPEDLGECLIELATSPERRVRMGRAARTLAAQRHDAARLRARIRDIYLEVAGLTPVQDRGDPGDQDGPAPTVIGTFPTPVVRAPSDGEGTDPEIGIAALSARSHKRRERRRRRREDTDPAAHTDPAGEAPEGPKIVMGTPLREAPPPPMAGPHSGSGAPARTPTPPPLPPRITPATVEVAAIEEVEPDAVLPVEGADDAAEFETADDAVLEADVPEGPPAEPREEAPLPEVASRMDAWFAQVVHGYCPPEGAQFQRPTPPTNFPGRDGPPPPTVQPPAAGPQSFPTRQSGG